MILAIPFTAHAANSSEPKDAPKIHCYNKNEAQKDEFQKYPPLVRQHGNDGGWIMNDTGKPVTIMAYPKTANVYRDVALAVADLFSSSLKSYTGYQDVADTLKKIKEGKNLLGPSGAAEASWVLSKTYDGKKGDQETVWKAIQAYLQNLDKKMVKIPAHCLTDLRGDDRWSLSGFSSYFSVLGWYGVLSKPADEEILEAQQCLEESKNVCTKGYYLNFDRLGNSKSYWINDFLGGSGGVSEMKATRKKPGAGQANVVVGMDRSGGVLAKWKALPPLPKPRDVSGTYTVDFTPSKGHKLIGYATSNGSFDFIADPAQATLMNINGKNETAAGHVDLGGKKTLTKEGQQTPITTGAGGELKLTIPQEGESQLIRFKFNGRVESGRNRPPGAEENNPLVNRSLISLLSDKKGESASSGEVKCTNVNQKSWDCMKNWDKGKGRYILRFGITKNS
ncbi:hypothetical protein [Streptomyces klenkii]|uniref:hypothetical protein n=1 Tax=Streptomyces klenkii TaxID=1420899 RepID=UPI0011C3E818|nr:hypothetical protein [Streptomyces klenkii]